MSPSLRKFVVVPLLIVLGIQCWLTLGRSDFGRPFQLRLLLAAVVVSLIPQINRVVLALVDRLRHPSRKAQFIVAAIVFLLSSIYLAESAWFQGRNFSPKWQDEMSYLVQFQQLARGRLWMPAYPDRIGDFFDSFQLIIDPVYASMYFPGAALFYTPAVWLHVPFWVVSVTLCGATVALIYLIMTELIDGWAGLLAVVMVLGTSIFRKLAIMIGGHPPFLLLEMLMIWSFLRWYRTSELRWLIALGAFAGWSAITRPLDAVVVALPLGMVLLWQMRRLPATRAFVSIACAVVSVAPFLALQLAANVGITGHWYRTPFEIYANRDYPGTMLGFHKFDPDLRPVSQLPQKQKFHDEWTIPAIQSHQKDQVLTTWLGTDIQHPGKLQGAIQDNMPHRMTMVMLPVGLLGLTNVRRIAVWAIFPLFVLLYIYYTFILPHYAIIALPAIVLWLLLGAHVLAGTWNRARAPVTMLVTLFIVILSVTETAELNRIVADEIFQAPPLVGIAAKLESLEHKPAVVLFRFDPKKNNPHEEPVYNTDVAWPDDAEVIRAHDLGARNIEIFRYYAQRQPDRAFYLYDRGDDSIRFLGFARDLGR